MGAAGFLAVCFQGDAGSGGADDITAVTYNAVSMTLAGKIDATTNRWTYLYFMPNAPSGAHTLTITSTSMHYLGAVTASYTGASTSGQPDAFMAYAQSASNPYTTALSTVADNSWMLICSGAFFNNCTTTCTGRVQGAANNEPWIGDKGFAITPPGSVSISVSRNGGLSQGIQMMLSIAPVPPPVFRHKVMSD